ncbi:MAG TPA: hypothetical protein VN240_02240, partial [Propylenella sp.]|nr:hypothetical protein [Propylenella sp.]
RAAESVLNFMKPVLTVLAAALPMFGAAFAGIRAQGEFDGFAEAARMTAAELRQLDTRIRRFFIGSEPLTPLLDRTTSFLSEAARIMSNDLAAWQALYGRKQLTLPS